MTTKRTYKKWLPSDKDKLRELYPTTPNSELAKMFGCHRHNIEWMGTKLGLKKVINMQFRAGKPKAKEGDRNIQGGVPHIKYCGKWITVRKYNWLMAGLDIPEGYMVVAIGDKEDLSVENSRVMSKAEAARLAYQHRGENKGGRPSKPDSVRSIKAKRREERKEGRVTPAKAEQQKQKPIKSKSTAKPVSFKPVVVREISRPVPKKVETKYQTREVNMKELIPVKIDRKTTIYARKGQDVEEVRRRFLMGFKQAS